MYKLMANSRNLVTFARKLRQNQTEAEKTIWLKLRGKQIGDVKFRRQQPIGPYIVDFVCFERKIIIEIDGGQHNESELKRKDEERTVWLEERGYQILRFWDNEVLKNINSVLQRIKEALEKPSASPYHVIK